MRRRNQPERIHCNGGHKRVLAVAAGGLILAGVVVAANPGHAIATTPRPAVLVNPGDLIFPKHVTWHGQERKPPLKTLLRVYVYIYVAHRPQSFKGLADLYTYRLILTKKGLKWEPRRAKNAPAARLGMGDIPAAGQHVTWKFGGPIYPDWLCKPGRYFITISAHGVSSSGVPGSYLLYQPYAKGHQFQDTAFGTRPPDRERAMAIKRC